MGNDNIIRWGIFKINVGIFPFFEKWNDWSWFHLLGCYLLMLIFHDWGLPYIALIVWGLALVWELTDAIKPLWYDWYYLRPKWFNERLWRLLGYIGAADGFGIHDMIVSTIGVAGGAIFIWLFA